MTGAKISIIIPVYNTSRYLSQCLKSVISQDYKNLEIILVNDASTDKSLSICRSYAERDNRIKIIDKVVNEGLELARRSGLSLASGNYIMHLDSDDWLGNQKVISKMYEKAEETGADYVEINSYRSIDKFGILKKKRNRKKIFGIIEQPELYDKYFLSFFGRNLLSVTIWGKLYRKSFLNEIDIQPFGIKMGEDLAYNIQLFPYLKRIYVMEEAGYYYRFGGMTSKYNPNLLPDLKKLHKYKMELIDRFKYENAQITERQDLKNILKSEIEQRIRFKQGREEVITFLKEEIKDSVYKSIFGIDKSSAFWEDPFVKAWEEEDIEKMYEISFQNEKQKSIKRGIFKIGETICRRLRFL